MAPDSVGVLHSIMVHGLYCFPKLQKRLNSGIRLGTRVTDKTVCTCRPSCSWADTVSCLWVRIDKRPHLCSLALMAQIPIYRKVRSLTSEQPTSSKHEGGGECLSEGRRFLLDMSNQNYYCLDSGCCFPRKCWTPEWNLILTSCRNHT